MTKLSIITTLILILAGSVQAQTSVQGNQSKPSAIQRYKPDLTIAKARGGKSGPIIYTPDGSALAVCDGTGKIKFWHTQTGELVQTLSNEANVLKFVFKSNGTLVAMLANSKIAVWDLTSGTLLTHTHTLNIETPRRVVFRPGANPEFAVPSGDRTRFELWNYQTGEKLKTFTPEQPARYVRFSPDGTKILAHTHETESGAEPTNDSVEIFDVDSGESLGRINFRTMGHILPTNSFFLSGADGAVTLYPYDKSLPTRTFATGLKDESYAAMDVSSGGDLIAAGTLKGPINVWDAATARHLGTFEGHQEVITELAFADNNRNLASGDRGGAVSFWTLPEAAAAPDRNP